MGWVTVSEVQLPLQEIILGISRSGQLSLAIPPLVGVVSINRYGVQLRVKAGMGRTW